MPTGYTSCIGEGADFKQFALSCARAFGALVTMRDEPSNVEIPDEFLPSDYHKKKIKTISRQLAKIRKLSNKECAELSKKEYNSEVKKYKKYISDNEKLAEKYQKILKEVEQYIPPSSDHVEYKNFMIQQINSSLEFDCDGSYYKDVLNNLKLLSGEEYKKQKIKQLEADLIYNHKEYDEEVKRCNERTKWIQDLKKSLGIEFNGVKFVL